MILFIFVFMFTGSFLYAQTEEQILIDKIRRADSKQRIIELSQYYDGNIHIKDC